jgi:hypothetical protein
MVANTDVLQALSAEYSTLQAARSGTVFESNGRINVYLSTVSSFVVALAFIGNVSRVGKPFLSSLSSFYRPYSS